jgi:DNA-binding GntR family transcriptional regulator
MSAPPRSTRGRSAEVYTDIRRKLLLGEFPLVERLAEVRLAEQFGASRTPVREALVRLESEGLVVRRPEGGFFPRSPNLAEVLELYELRRIIEVAALVRRRRDGGGHHQAMLNELLETWRGIAQEPPNPDPDFVLIDEEFHVGLAAAAGNRALADQLQSINERIRVVRMQNFIDPRRIEITAGQHIAILEHTVAGQTQEAAQMMGEHLDEAVEQAAQRAAAAIERMLTAGALLSLGASDMPASLPDR